MRRLLFTTLALCAFALPMTGCRTSSVKLLIPDFDSSYVLGISFWKQTQDPSATECLQGRRGTVCYEPVGSIVFDEIEVRTQQAAVTSTRTRTRTSRRARGSWGTTSTAEPTVVEYLHYHNTNDLTGAMGDQVVVLNRDEATGAVTLEVTFLLLTDEQKAAYGDEVGSFKVKTFNAAGSSPLSSETIRL